MPAANSPSFDVLGVDIGNSDTRSNQFRAACAKVAATREAIDSIGDSATELVLTRMCANVCKVTHLLRAHGSALRESELKEFDRSLMVGVASALEEEIEHGASFRTRNRFHCARAVVESAVACQEH